MTVEKVSDPLSVQLASVAVSQQHDCHGEMFRLWQLRQIYELSNRKILLITIVLEDINKDDKIGKKVQAVLRKKSRFDQHWLLATEIKIYELSKKKSYIRQSY